MANKKANGSGDLLTRAMKQVFSEVFGEKVEPVMNETGSIEGRLNDRIDTTNENMQSQSAE